MLSEYPRIIFPTGRRTGTAEFGGAGLSGHFLAGAAGVVLGVLTLLGIASIVLTSVALVAFGAAMVLSSNSDSRLNELKRTATPIEG